MSENNSGKILVNLQNYQELACRTKKEMSSMVLPIDSIKDDHIVKETKEHLGKVLDNIHMVLGVSGEFSELYKAVVNNDIPNIIEESGDILWFVAVMCQVNDLEFYKIAETAIQSLDVEESHSNNGYDDGGLIDVIKRYAIYSDGYVDDVKTFSIKLIPYLTNIVRIVINQTYWLGSNGYDINEILQINIDKLVGRFGDKFSSYMALNRNLEAERSKLEDATE